MYCVIPAAGRSSRMGAWKPMLPWGATSVCGAVIELVLSAGLKPIIVAGYRADELVSAFSGRPDLTVVVNPDWERGMLGSVRAGLGCIVEPIAGFFVAPADMPRLPPAAFSLISADLYKYTEPRAIFAARGGQLGHPVWIPAAFIPDIEGLDPGSRLRDYLLRRPWSSVEVDDVGIFADLDTPEEYQDLCDADFN